MNWIFRGFCINRSSRSDFGFEFLEIFVFEKQLPDSTIRGVGDSPYQRYAESATLQLNDTGSRRLSASLIRGVNDSLHHRYESRLLNFLKENLLYRWYGESLTPHISYAESRRLPVSLSRRVAAVIRGVASWKKICLDFQYFKRLKHAFKGSIWPKISQECNLLSKLNYLKVWK